MCPGYQEDERSRKIKLIRAINKILESRERQLSPDDFDILYDLDFDELARARFLIQEKYDSKALENQIDQG